MPTRVGRPSGGGRALARTRLVLLSAGAALRRGPNAASAPEDGGSEAVLRQSCLRAALVTWRPASFKHSKKSFQKFRG